MADAETARLKQTARRIIEQIFKVSVADGGGDVGRPRVSWQEHLGMFILENDGDASRSWEPSSLSRDIGLAL